MPRPYEGNSISMIEQSVSLERIEDAPAIFGSFDSNIRMIENELTVRVGNRNS